MKRVLTLSEYEYFIYGEIKMPVATLEERVTELEKKVDSTPQENHTENPCISWWQAWIGASADRSDFNASMACGAEYRRSQPESTRSQSANLSILQQAT